mgnify:FL=1
MANAPDIKHQIADSLRAFASKPLYDAGLGLLNALGYRSELTLKLKGVKDFRETIDQHGRLNDKAAKVEDWKNIEFLRQITGNELSNPGQGTLPLQEKGGFQSGFIKSYVFLAIELKNDHHTRTELAQITRSVNRVFDMPAMIVFKHGPLLTLSIINRRLHKRDDSKDVLEKVTLIKDIQIASPHRAHIEILFDLSVDELRQKHAFSNFDELHTAWRKALDSSELNKRFFREVANWYFWAVQNVTFPKDAGENKDIRNATSVIRLITRLIFCWFMKEKGLVSDDLFTAGAAQGLLNDDNPKHSAYYKAILQNLFFATLNQEMGKREFRKAGQNFMIHNLYRYKQLLKKPDETLKLFSNIPFLNGGLFECLDKSIGTIEKPNYIRIDGFSDRDDNMLSVPDFLFFGDEQDCDLNEVYDTRNKTYKVRGLIHIFNRYKFTINENTPIEEEIALDPELLGKVFENLLAAYNPETGATARKQTGSFYTPREYVNYMVDESLIAYLTTTLERHSRPGLQHSGAGSDGNPEAVQANQNTGELDARLRISGMTKNSNIAARLHHLFAYNEEPHQFTEKEVELLIEAIDSLKILDPACGSGAFPMGILHKLVFILGKLDPGNERWKARQIAKLDDVVMREELERVFRDNYDDYGRKLYLIENCIYGVDIQPIAVQIAKLRFFISLLVDQKINDALPNRGIRPLPNLETKFVAANTLLGIDKPVQMLLRNPDIDKKEAELKRVRDQHFNAKTPATKRKWREKDEQLRKELGELFLQDGFKPETAKKLSQWDPYDQNTSAHFFDMEWMFGIQNGFDICIGNPPYGIDFQESELKQVVSVFPQAKKIPDSYCFFILKSFDLLQKDAVLSFIVPNTFCDLENGDNFRRHLLENKKITALWQSGWAFESAVVDTLVLFAQNDIPERESLVSITIDGLSYTRKNSEFLSNQMMKIDYRNPPGKGDLVRKIKRLSVLLGGILEVKAGVKMYEKGKGEPPQTDEILTMKPYSKIGKTSRGWKILYRGTDVSRYSLKVRSEFVNYGPWLAAPRNPELFTSPKILMRRTDDRLMSCIDYDSAIAVNSCHVIKLKSHHTSQLFYEYLLGILNSRLVQYVFEITNPQMVGKVFAEIKVIYVERLPIFPASASQQAPIIKRVKAILADPGSPDVPRLEKEIDEMVYALYGLTPDEIKIVESKRN